MTVSVAGYERLYSAAARMLTAQGSPTWRDDRWPEQRRQAWRALEAVLAAGGASAGAGDLLDPARELVALGQPFPAMVQSMREYLREDPDGVDQPVVLAGVLHSAITELLDELAARVTPGRPPVALGIDAAVLADVVHELADSLRVALGLPKASAPPSQRGRAVREPQPVGAGPAVFEQLAAVAKAAAEAVPAPEQLAQDFSVRHDVATAAADVRALVAGQDAQGWRERQADIRPESHLVAAYRWEGGQGRPLGFGDRAAEVRKVLDAAGPPWAPSLERPLPELAEDRTWILYSRRQALVTADLLDELAVRLTPGRWTGTIHFSAYPLQEFITTTLRAGTTEI